MTRPLMKTKLKKNWVTLQRGSPSIRDTLSPCKQVLRISDATKQNTSGTTLSDMMCSTGFLKVKHKLLWCVALGFLTHWVSFSSFLILKVLSSVSFVILALKSLTNTKHHLLRNVQTIKKTNFLGEIVKHRNFNFVSKIHLGRRNS